MCFWKFASWQRERPYCDHSFSGCHNLSYSSLFVTLFAMQSHCGRLATPWRMCIKPKGSLHLRGAPPMKSAKTLPRSVLAGTRVSMVTDWRRKDERWWKDHEGLTRFAEPLSLWEKVHSLGQNSCGLASTSELSETPPEKEQDNSTWVWDMSGFWVCSLLSKAPAAWDRHVTCDGFSFDFVQDNIT